MKRFPTSRELVRFFPLCSIIYFFWNSSTTILWDFGKDFDNKYIFYEPFIYLDFRFEIIKENKYSVIKLRWFIIVNEKYEKL